MYAYFSIFIKGNKAWLSVFYTAITTCMSLCLGVFLAFNTYGT
jgi:hypothetical protein